MANDSSGRRGGRRPAEHTPRYQVQLAVGQRLEPWIESLTTSVVQATVCEERDWLNVERRARRE